MKRLIRVPPSAHVDAGGSVIRRRDRNGGSMASTKVADYILQRLREWDVDHVFAYAGDGINGLLAAWGRADNDRA